MKQVLITGANGQIGSDLADALLRRYPQAEVLCTDLQTPSVSDFAFNILDVRNRDAMHDLIERRRVDTVFHLASLLSAKGEQQPDETWNVNMDGLKHVLDAARRFGCRVFWPSSIAVFGPATPKENAPQQTVLDPDTMYGVTKVSGELLCRYYHQRYGVDVRSLRYPGLISYTAPPGGGTTDYAVKMFYAAVRGNAYRCFVRPETRLPMMYMPDALQAALDLMEAETDRITVRTSYNIGALSFTAGELAEALQEAAPGFTCRFEPDERQQIADSWPTSVDDGPARRDWNWQPEYDLDALVADMLDKLTDKLSIAR